MSIVRFDSPAEYFAAAAPLVAHDEARSVGLLAWVEGLKLLHVPERTFMAIWQSGTGCGVAHQRGNPWPVFVGDSCRAACAAFADALGGEHPELQGVVGQRAACEAFVQQWSQRTGRIGRFRHHMRDHRLARLIAARGVRGHARLATLHDRAWLVTMQLAFVHDAGLPTMTTQSAERAVHDRLIAGRFRIWNDGDADVAFAGYVPAGRSAARIAPVFTLPAYRGNGYASAIVAALCVELAEQGRSLYLVTDVTNAVSNALYARLGFEPLGDHFTYDLVESD